MTRATSRQTSRLTREQDRPSTGASGTLERRPRSRWATLRASEAIPALMKADTVIRSDKPVGSDLLGRMLGRSEFATTIMRPGRSERLPAFGVPRSRAFSRTFQNLSSASKSAPQTTLHRRLDDQISPAREKGIKPFAGHDRNDFSGSSPRFATEPARDDFTSGLGHEIEKRTALPGLTDKTESAASANNQAGNTSGPLILSGEIVIDGRRLGQVFAASQSKSLNAAPSGARTLNLRSTPIGLGLNIPPP